VSVPQKISRKQKVSLEKMHKSTTDIPEEIIAYFEKTHNITVEKYYKNAIIKLAVEPDNKKYQSIFKKAESLLKLKNEK